MTEIYRRQGPRIREVVQAKVREIAERHGVGSTTTIRDHEIVYEFTGPGDVAAARNEFAEYRRLGLDLLDVMAGESAK
ncbi:MAG: hypothetical protein WCC64_07680 [Aliidongia sp.]